MNKVSTTLHSSSSNDSDLDMNGSDDDNEEDDEEDDDGEDMSEYDELIEPADSMTLNEFQNGIHKEAIASKGPQIQLTSQQGEI